MPVRDTSPPMVCDFPKKLKRRDPRKSGESDDLQSQGSGERPFPNSDATPPAERRRSLDTREAQRLGASAPSRLLSRARPEAKRRTATRRRTKAPSNQVEATKHTSADVVSQPLAALASSVIATGVTRGASARSTLEGGVCMDRFASGQVRSHQRHVARVRAS